MFHSEYVASEVTDVPDEVSNIKCWFDIERWFLGERKEIVTVDKKVAGVYVVINAMDLNPLVISLINKCSYISQMY